MEFTKYQKYGAYHWKQYEDKNTKYAKHADRVKEWVKEADVIDIGCGDGLITHLLGKNAIGFDNEPEAVKLAKQKGVKAEYGHICELPCITNEFEAAFLGDVLEHIEDYRAALKEVRRVTRTYLYLVVPEKGTNNDKFHYQEWTSEEILKLIREEGFELEGDVMLSPQLKRIYLKCRKKK